MAEADWKVLAIDWRVIARERNVSGTCSIRRREFWRARGHNAGSAWCDFAAARTTNGSFARELLTHRGFFPYWS